MRQIKTSTGFVLELIDGGNQGSGIPMGNLRMVQPNGAQEVTVDSEWFAAKRKTIVCQLSEKQYRMLLKFDNLTGRRFAYAVMTTTKKRHILRLCNEMIEKLNEMEHNQLKRGV